MSDEQYRNQLRKSLYAAAIALPLLGLSSCYVLRSDSKYSKILPAACTGAVLASVAAAVTATGKKTIDDLFK